MAKLVQGPQQMLSRHLENLRARDTELQQRVLLDLLIMTPDPYLVVARMHADETLAGRPASPWNYG